MDKEHKGRHFPVVLSKNVSDISKMITDDNHCTYEEVQKEINIGSTTKHKISHEQLR